MNIFGITLTSRSEKRAVLSEIIRNLPVSSEEKELYLFSIDVLDDSDFDVFFAKILRDFSGNYQINPTLSPLT